jgi:SAM-dependent methyltransferase
MKTFETADGLKTIVKEKYSAIALQSKETNSLSCCGASCGCGTVDAAVMAEDYGAIAGYQSEADLGLGCGLPTEFARIREGDTVIDLGSGAGNDAFVARAIVGDKGRVIGIDFTEKMIEKARINVEKLGFNNVEFRFGDIENIPVKENVADVVVSNCVLNLVPDKAKAFAETFRILKPGGHFSVSDIVLQGELPEALVKNAEMYAGCVSGAIQKEHYLETIRQAGFISVTIQKEKIITIPNEIMESVLSKVELNKFLLEKTGIYSITVYAEKPEQPVTVDKERPGDSAASCCGADGCC